MSNKTKIIISIAALVLAYTSGRYMAPTKVITEVKTVEVEKKQSKTDAEREKHKKTVIIERPDGSKETTITENTDTSKKTDSSSDSRTDSSSRKVVERGIGANISALGGIRLDGYTPVFGASISKPVLGPITIGIWGLSDKTLGASVGLQF